MFTSAITYILFITCPNTIMINENREPWDNDDKKVFDRAFKVCASDPRYSDTPCLKTFIKRAEARAYAAVCAPETSRHY